MTTDEMIVASDTDEIGWVLGKVKQYSAKNSKLMFVIKRQGFYWMTEEYKPIKECFAKVYPGGRIELGRIDGEQ